MKALRILDRKLQTKIERRVIRKAARPVLASAKRLIPQSEPEDITDEDHRSGELRRSLKLRTLKRTRSLRRRGIYGMRVFVSLPAEEFYGYFPEFGTIHQGAQGFMNASAHENQQRTKAIFHNELRQELRNALAEVKWSPGIRSR